MDVKQLEEIEKAFYRAETFRDAEDRRCTVYVCRFCGQTGAIPHKEDCPHALVAEVRKLEEECTRLANTCFKYNRIAQDAEHRTHITKKAMEWWRNVARGTPAPPITRRTVGKFLALVHAENEAEKLEAEVERLSALRSAGLRQVDSLVRETDDLRELLGLWKKRAQEDQEKADALRQERDALLKVREAARAESMGHHSAHYACTCSLCEALVEYDHKEVRRG